MDVIVRPHVLSDRDAATLDVPEGVSLAQMVDAFPWPPGVERHVVALVNGEVIPREWWPRVHPRAGARVMVALGLSGGQKDKAALALIASIAVSVAAPWAAVNVFGAAAGSVSAGMVAAGLAIVGNLIVAAIFKPPPVQFNENTPQGSRQYNTFSGQSNAVRPYGVLPRVLGTHRVYPDLIGTPFTSIEGGEHDQWLTALYCFGYGGVKIDTICIGDSPISKYADADYEPHESFVRGNKLRIYTSDVQLDQYARSLEKDVPVAVTTRPSTDSAVIDISFPEGLGRVSTTTGAVTSWDVYITFRFRNVLLGGPFISLSLAPWWALSEGKLAGSYYGTIVAPVVQGSDPAQPKYAQLAAGTTTIRMASIDPEFPTRPPAKFDYMRIGDVRMTVNSNVAGLITFTAPLPKTISEPYTGTGVQGAIPTRWYTNDVFSWRLSRGKLDHFIASVSIRFPERGQWEIEVTGGDPPPIAPDIVRGRNVLVGLRSMTATDPVVPEADVPLALLELKIRATDQLSGVVQNLNAIVTTEVPTWTGTAWTAPDVKDASNPAWQFCELLRGVANSRAIDADPAVAPKRLDMATIKRWAAYCDRQDAPFTQPNGRCNFVVDKPYTLWELLTSVATAGRAMPTMKDNRYSVIIDEETKPEVQVFSPRNSWDLSARRKYLPLPDALNIKWVNPAIGYKEADAPIYQAGFSVDGAGGTEPAKIFETLPLFGCTNWEQANRDGRLWFARAQLQQEEFSVSTDIENVVCTRGDMIGIAHDVLQVGGWSARLAAISGNLVQFDSDLKSFAKPWALRHRSDAAVISAPLPFSEPVAQPGWYTVPNLPAAAKVGDLVLYGTLSLEQGLYIVKAVTPGNDLTATIDCIEYAPGIYAAEKAGTIPAYVPQGHSAVVLDPRPPASLSATINEWSIDRYPHAGITLQWSSPQSVVLPSVYIVYGINADGTRAELGRTTGLTFTPLPDVEVWMAPYAGAVLTYEVVAQWPGIPGPAARISVQLPTGAILPLPAIAGLTAATQPPEIVVSWTASLTRDLAYYVIRWAPVGADWNLASTAATEVKLKANKLVFPAKLFAAGDYTVFAVAEDYFGTRNEPATTTFHVDTPRAVTVSGTSVQNTVFLRWGTLSGVVGGEWSAQTTWQIAFYEVTKQRLASGAVRRRSYGLGLPAGVVTAQDDFDRRLRDAGETPTDLGKYSGEFAVLSEQQDGRWNYCMRGIDLAGNAAPYACIEVAVLAPDDYVLLDSLVNMLPEPQCTKVNTIFQADGTWLAPFDTTQTWQQHFESHGWTSPQDQIDAGYPIYAQPADSTVAVFSWSHDYEKNLPVLHSQAQAFYTAVGGVPRVSVVLLAKVDAGDPWTEVARGLDVVGAMLLAQTRYVRVDVEIESDAAGAALAFLQRVEYRLDVQMRDDGGVVAVPAGGATPGVARVFWNINFFDVRTVSLTSASTSVVYARYVLAPDDSYMDVYAFDLTGAPAGGNVAWSASGV